MLSLSFSLSSPAVLRPRARAVISLSSGHGYAGSVYHSDRAGGQWHADGVPVAGATAQDWTMPLSLEGAAVDYRIAGLASNAIEMWMPTDLPSVAAVMDVRQGISLSAGLISGWTSQSGGVAATQGSGSLQPAYGATAFAGAPGSVWDGSDLLTGLAIPDGPAARSYVGGLALGAGTTGALYVFDANTSGGYGLRVNADNSLSVFASSTGARATSAPVITRGNAMIVSSRIGPSSYDFREAGLSIGSGIPGGGFAGTGNCRIGSDRLGTMRMVGTIASHVVADAYLSDADLARAEGWLAWTLGKADLLSTGHAFKVAPPRRV